MTYHSLLFPACAYRIELRQEEVRRDKNAAGVFLRPLFGVAIHRLLALQRYIAHS